MQPSTSLARTRCTPALPACRSWPTAPPSSTVHPPVRGARLTAAGTVWPAYDRPWFQFDMNTLFALPQ